MVENFTLGYYYYKLINALPIKDKDSVFVSIIDYIFQNTKYDPTKLNQDVFRILETKLDASKKHPLKLTKEQKEFQKLIFNFKIYKENKRKKELNREYVEQRSTQYYNTIMAITDGDLTKGINILQYYMNNIQTDTSFNEIRSILKAIEKLQWERQKEHGELLSITDNETNPWQLISDNLDKERHYAKESRRI